MRYAGMMMMVAWATLAQVLAAEQPSGEAKAIVSQTRVQFRTSNSLLQKVFDEAEKKAEENIADLGKYKVLVYGGQYKTRLWLETEPTSGCMYAKRDVEIARNNQLIFMDLQREDGRLAGAIGYKEGRLTPRYNELQGNYLPLEAFDVYYWIGKDRDYLNKLYTTLAKYDNYLWKTRDSDHNGCLESWCTGDTGEDRSTRFGKSYHSWKFDFAPTRENLENMSEADSKTLRNEGMLRNVGPNISINNKSPTDALEYDSPMPMESMDVMSYSFANRAILARISEILQNGQSEYWRSRSLDVQKKIKEYLWIPERHACFDRDKNNAVMDVLTHNNLRCMYFGSFDQEMADQFVKYHLMNPKEFWTPMPLPSIAANDPAFRNIPGNDWSGQPQAITYQRSIRALENYGHYAELTLIGEKFLKVTGDSLKFTQQFDPFKATSDNSLFSAYYGPGILSALEFISRLHGIHISRDKVYWSCLDDQQTYEYSQEWDNRRYQMATKGDRVICSVNGKEVLSFSKGIRVVTDGNGKIIETIGISTKDQKAIIEISGKPFPLTVAPNAIYSFTNNRFQESKKVEFYSPDSSAAALTSGAASAQTPPAESTQLQSALKKGQQADPAAAWYESSFIHTHMSIGFRQPDFPIDLFKRQVAQVRPDVIGSGQPNMSDLVAELGFRQCIVINRAGTWAKNYDSDNAYLFRVNADGTPTGRVGRGLLIKHLCLNSPGVDRDIIPYFVKAAQTVHPAQIWMDDTTVTVNLCYCENCRQLFEQLVGRAPPTSASSPDWDRWTAFHRDVFVHWMEKLTTAVHAVDPNIVVTFNQAYFVSQPEPPPPFIKNISADILAAPFSIGFFARYGSTAGVPFDIMPGLCRDTWAGVNPKSLDQVLEDTALITANGGRWNIGEFPTAGARPVETMVELARRGAEFARLRQPWTHQTESVPLAAILHSASTHYARISPPIAPSAGLKTQQVLTSEGQSVSVQSMANPRVYWVNNNQPAAGDLMGAYAALIENHVHFDILNEAVLRKRLSEYRLLVLSDQFRLDDATKTAIRRFVENGGVVLATGSTIQAGLPEVLGVVGDGEFRPSPVELADKGTRTKLSGYWPVKLAAAEVVQRFENPPDVAAVTRNHLGRGTAVYVSADLFRACKPSSPSAEKPSGMSEPLRKFTGSLLAEVLGDSPVQVSAPPWIEVALRRKGHALLVQLVDRSIEWRELPADRETAIKLQWKLPSEPRQVLLQPGNQKADWKWQGGQLHVVIPVSQVDRHRIVEIQLPAS